MKLLLVAASLGVAVFSIAPATAAPMPVAGLSAPSVVETASTWRSGRVKGMKRSYHYRVR